MTTLCLIAKLRQQLKTEHNRQQWQEVNVADIVIVINIQYSLLITLPVTLPIVYAAFKR